MKFVAVTRSGIAHGFDAVDQDAAWAHAQEIETQITCDDPDDWVERVMFARQADEMEARGQA